MEHKFNIGDTVKLKSGSEIMTVNGYVGDITKLQGVDKGRYISPEFKTEKSLIVICKWIDVLGNEHEGKYHQDSLVVASIQE